MNKNMQVKINNIIRICKTLAPLLEGIEQEITDMYNQVDDKMRELDSEIWDIQDKMYAAEKRGDEREAERLEDQYDKLQTQLSELEEWVSVAEGWGGNYGPFSNLKEAINEVLESGSEGFLDLPDLPK